MKPTDSNEISRRRLLAMGGLSTGAAMLAPTLAFADPGSECAAAVPFNRQPPATRPSPRSSKSMLASSTSDTRKTARRDGPPVILLQGWPYDITALSMSRPCSPRKAIE